MKVLENTIVDKEDVRRMPDARLTALGVRILNKQELILQCLACGKTWSPQLDSDGKLLFDYWVCPAKCNE